jgi:hypothetical protein
MSTELSQEIFQMNFQAKILLDKPNLLIQQQQQQQHANLNNYINSPSKLILPQLNASVVSGGSGGGSASVGSGTTAGSLPISTSNTLNSK